MMKKSAIICGVILSASVVLLACNKSTIKSEPYSSVLEAPKQEVEIIEDSETEEIAMTESFIEGRQVFYDATGILLPEVANARAISDSIEQGTYFDVNSDRNYYETSKNVMAETLGEPFEENINLTSWKIEQASITECYDIYYDDSDPNDTWIYINYYIEKK